MTKLFYNDPTARHQPYARVVLQDEGAELPYATFVEGIFETDDKKLVERLLKLPEVTEYTEPAAEEADSSE